MVVLLIKIVGRNNRRIVDGCRALKHLFSTGSRAELVDPGAHRFGERRLVVLSHFDDGVLIGRAHLFDVGQGPAGKEVNVPVMSGPVQPLVPFGDIGIPAPKKGHEEIGIADAVAPEPVNHEPRVELFFGLHGGQFRSLGDG